MQSPARQTADAPARASLAQGNAVPGGAPAAAQPRAGAVADAGAFRSPSGAAGHGGVGADQDGSLARPDTGWLSLGGERVFSVPGACVAP
jgi:hypothetical protein